MAPLAGLESTEADDAMETYGLRDVLKLCELHFVFEELNYGQFICTAEPTDHNRNENQNMGRAETDIN